MTATIAVYASDATMKDHAEKLAAQLKIPCTTTINSQYDYLLVLTAERLALHQNKPHPPKPLSVDFITGKMGHRIQYGGGKGQLIARAVGLKGKRDLTVLDVTAGLGKDGFILANLGAQVLLLERSKIIAALLADGLKRAREHEWVRRLSIDLIVTDAKQYLLALTPAKFPDVIYLDPMFPDSRKSALVKVEMRMLRDIVGEDIDAPQLLKLALSKVLKRVVVKRARLAPEIVGPKPNFTVAGKSSRFDVYLPTANK